MKIPLIVTIVVSMTICLTSCKKNPTPPVVTTADVSAITQTSALSGGNVTSNGGAEVTGRGVCWSTSEEPTTKDNKTSDGQGEGAYITNLTQLSPGTKYYVRAYSTNDAGTGYGKQLSFTTGEIILATLTTSSVTSVTETTAVSGGNITSSGGGTITSRGVCWSSTSQNPTTTDSKTMDGPGTGNFTSNITGLTPGTEYYVRAYATNSAGTSYGSPTSFVTSQGSGSGINFNPSLTYGTVTDVDGNTYKTIQIEITKGTVGSSGVSGTKASMEWMAENLKTTKYNDGTDIPQVTDNTEWTSLSSPGYCWYNNDATSYKDTYGALYNWYAVNTHKLCPDGWHIPTDEEWTALMGPAGMTTSTNSGLFRETGTTHWNPLNTGATNETGFTALPGGYRHDLIGSYSQIKLKGYWWSSTEVFAQTGSISAWNRELTGGEIYILRYNYNKKTGFSVRCVR